MVSSTITVQQQDAYGNGVDVTGSDLDLTVTSSNGITGSFYETNGTTALASPKITVGSSSKSFKYRDTHVSSPTLTTQGAGLTDGSQVEAVTPGPVSAADSTVTAFPATVINDGLQASTITVTLMDAFGNVVAGKAASLTPDSGTSSTVTVVAGTTDASGRATFHVSDLLAETVTYTADDTTDPITLIATRAVSFQASAVNPANSSVARSASSAPADGTTTVTITVTLKDGSNAAISSAAVSLNQNGSSTIAPASASTNGSGVATFTVKAATAQAVSYAVIVGGVAVLQTSLTFGP
ncbi:MAG: hypothetical protein E6I60_16485 [Chloroflexi bacterium]|nr:MAG: hypothetical protein E6I60_16485 [Chloroflexota bacterium]